MSWGQKKHTDAILRARYEETKAREGPSPDGRPLSTTIGLRSGALEKERRAPTSASLVGNTMNIVEWGTGDPQPPLFKDPPPPVAEKDRFEQFAATRDEAASLRSMVGNVRQPGGGFYTGACTHY